MRFTREQETIIHHRIGHARVSAVAGSGKTTAMVGRVQYLLQQGAAAKTILILMFNRSARDAFAAKLEQNLQGSGLQPPDVRTFHSLGLRLVNSFSRRNFLPVCRLVSEEYQQEMLAREAVKRHAAEAGGDEEWWSKENLEEFFLFIGLVKAHTDPAAVVFADYGFEERLSYYIEAYQLFESMRIRAGIRFYEDLIHEPVMAIRQQQQLADWVGGHLDHIIVDEYQDINEVQQQLLKYLAGKRAAVMVVGDVDQCIYEWRGAKPEYIISRFSQDFPRPVSYTLSYTFRYGHRLALAANHLISNNRLRDRKLCIARPENPDTRISCLAEGKGLPLISCVQEWQEQGRGLHEAAVLVRIYAQTVPVELALLEHEIPYRLVGHDTVFSCTEIRALLGYLQLCQGTLATGDPESGLATVMAMLITPHLWLKKDALRALAKDILAQPGLAGSLICNYAGKYAIGYPAERMISLAGVWQEVQALPSTTAAGQVLDKVVRETELYDHYLYASRPAVAENRIKTCTSFIRFACQSGQDVAGFLAAVKELEQYAASHEQQKEHLQTADNVLLLTSIHRAKGLEWPLVILPGLEDGVVPFRQAGGEGEIEDIEDERRLFYVAMTRAMEKLCLIHPSDSRLQERQKAGDSRSPLDAEKGSYPASCFLYEANLQFSDQLGERVAACQSSGSSRTDGPLAAVDLTIGRRYCRKNKLDIPLRQSVKTGPAKPAASSGPPALTMADLATGMLVKHEKLGNGIVTAVEQHNGVVTIQFEEQGSMRLVVRYAGLTAAVNDPAG
jgi:DNA helicase-2/ATP-dependent DNA helicase PcrA